MWSASLNSSVERRLNCGIAATLAICIWNQWVRKAHGYEQSLPRTRGSL
jgi:hypothetical protein